MGAAYGGINGEEIPGSFLDRASDHGSRSGNLSLIGRQAMTLISAPRAMARLGKSIAKQSEGRAGGKYLPVGGRAGG